MAVDQLKMARGQRAQLGFGEERKIMALELIADALIEIRDRLDLIMRGQRETGITSGFRR